jgi:arginyl-tRNA synthetase
MAEQAAALGKLENMNISSDATPSNTNQVASIRQEVASAFTAAISKAFPGNEMKAVVAQCQQAIHGDYQCNNAMGLFGKMKGKEGAPKNPRAIAEAILQALDPSAVQGAIEETSLAGPGFINIKLSRDWLATHISSMLTNGISSWAPKGYSHQKVIVDFSSPNVAKEMHVGHLRSTIIGDTLARCLEYCGADVLRLNHIGDWGTQFGMLIQFMAEKREGGLNASTDEDVADLQVLYRAAKARFDEDEVFKTRAREAVTQLQSGDADYKRAWERICEASRKEFQKIYDRLGVELNERGESFYNPMLKDTVDDLMARGVAEISEGATCVFVEGQQIPLIVQKTDGGFGYASTDMAAIKHRINEEKADWIIYVTDLGQSQHFDMVFAAAKKAGYFPTDRTVKIDHVGFGLVLGDDGKKFRSRSGDVVRLVELLDEAKQRCSDTIKERRPDISDEELEASSSAMGYGAVKYADLKSHRKTDYRFSYDDMLSLQGNTAVYLLYAHARIGAIIRKSGTDVPALAASGSKIILSNDKETALALHIARFPEALEEALNDLVPNRLCEYLYELSGVFNQFYTECQVIGSGEYEESRLLLCEACAVVMRKCFELLGITILHKL